MLPYLPDILAEVDPALTQAIGVLSGALAMAIASIVSFYFPKDHDRFDKPPRRRKNDDQEVDDE